METIYFNGQPCHTYGEVPVVGSKAPDFKLIGKDLNEISLDDFKGKTVVLNVFPSLDTPVCAASVRRFNQEASKLKDTVVVCVSMDLPFAMSRFCTTEGLDNVVVASAFRSPKFAQEYGLQLVDGPLEGLLARCVLIIDKDGKVEFRDLVNEITMEPDYDAAIRVLEGKFY
ncbi:MAG: thiol peroxidase [Muribaculaceae bacterium]|nr:thiol peroxidase [Muribaculaceae bacterium]